MTMHHIINKSNGKLVLPVNDITLNSPGDIVHVDEETATSKEVRQLVAHGWIEVKKGTSVLTSDPVSKKAVLVFSDDDSQGSLTPFNEVNVEDLNQETKTETETSPPKPRAKKAVQDTQPSL